MRLGIARAAGRAKAVSLAFVLVLIGASAASADTVVVTANTALVWNRPSGAGFVLTQLAKDTKLDVVGRAGDWYEVLLPVPAQGAKTGFVRADQVAIDTRGPMSPAAQLVATANAGSTAIRLRPAFFNLDIGARTGNDFVRTSRAFGERYPESGSISANYGGGSGYQFDAMGSQAVWGQVALALGVSFYQRKTTTTITATIPHPVTPSAPRLAKFETTSPSGTELTIHLPVVWIPVTGAHVKVLVFGGLSAFRVSQDVVSDVALTDPPPYGAPTITSVTLTKIQGNNVGFNLGGDVGYFFTNTMGVGAGARYTRATSTLNGDEATLDAVSGTTEIVAGLRFRF